MNIRRPTYEEAKSLKEFDVFLGERRIDYWRGELFVCVDGVEVVGYISHSSNMFYNRPYIVSLCVRESHRRKGIGRQLIQRVLSMYEGLEVWASTESWNVAASGLFNKLGFIKKGEIAGLDGDENIEHFFVFRAALAGTNLSGSSVGPPHLNLPTGRRHTPLRHQSLERAFPYTRTR